MKNWMKILPQIEGASSWNKWLSIYLIYILIHLYTFTSGVLDVLDGVDALMLVVSCGTITTLA
jgi:hypothetical protein